MSNMNDRETYNRDAYNNPDRNLSGVNGTNETNLPDGTARPVVTRDSAYRDGYVHGRDEEQYRYEADQTVRDNDNAARGLLLGILLTSLVGLGAAAYFLTQRHDEAAPPQQTIIVPRASQSPSPQPSTQVRERVIERDRVVPVPQQQAPAPNVNIAVPNPTTQTPKQSSSSQSAPAPRSTPSQTQTDGSASQSTQQSSPQSTQTDSTASPTSGSTGSSSSQSGQSSPSGQSGQ